MSDIPRQPRDFPIGPFAEAAERWFDDTQPRPEPTVPAQAATVLLVRGEPVEVFMIERAATMDATARAAGAISTSDPSIQAAICVAPPVHRPRPRIPLRLTPPAAPARNLSGLVPSRQR